MPSLITIAGGAVSSARATADLAALPLRVASAVLASPRAARRDPTSTRLSELRHLGWRPSAVRLMARSTEVDLERDGEHETVVGASLAFAAYATRTGVAARATIVHQR